MLALQFRTLLNTRIFLCVGIARIVCLTAVSVKFYRKHLNRFFNDRQDKEDYRGQTTDCRKGIIRTRRTADTRKSDASSEFDAARILGNDQIKDERIRQAQQEKQRRMYHNTRLLLEQYRNIAWALECFPDTIAAELDHPLGDLDSLLGKMDLEMGLGNRKLESRLESVKKSRLLLDRVNEALTVLKRKPDNGPKMYELIYQTYLAPEKLSHADLLYRLDISSRHYYRLRQQAITILSIRLWSAPSNEVDSWLEILTLLKAFDENVMVKKKGTKLARWRR